MDHTRYADVARISPLTVSEMEQWCQSRQVSAGEAFTIWQAAQGDRDQAQYIWENEDWWTRPFAY